MQQSFYHLALPEEEACLACMADDVATDWLYLRLSGCGSEGNTLVRDGLPLFGACKML